jgi:cell division GTPase FtsZ
MSAAYRYGPDPVPLARHHGDGTVSIRVVGVGGAGGNAVARMVADDITGVEFIVANTDYRTRPERRRQRHHLRMVRRDAPAGS